MNTLLEPHGLTLGQFGILHHVVRQRTEEGSRISDIAVAVEVGQPAVTKTIAKFQNLGLVTVVGSASDKRSKKVAATKQAGLYLQTIYKDIGPDLFEMFGSVEPAEFEQFVAQLKHLGKWLDQNRLKT